MSKIVDTLLDSQQIKEIVLKMLFSNPDTVRKIILINNSKSANRNYNKNKMKNWG